MPAWNCAQCTLEVSEGEQAAMLDTDQTDRHLCNACYHEFVADVWAEAGNEGGGNLVGGVGWNPPTRASMINAIMSLNAPLRDRDCRPSQSQPGPPRKTTLCGNKRISSGPPK